MVGIEIHQFWPWIFLLFFKIYLSPCHFLHLWCANSVFSWKICSRAVSFKKNPVLIIALNLATDQISLLLLLVKHSTELNLNFRHSLRTARLSLVLGRSSCRRASGFDCKSKSICKDYLKRKKLLVIRFSKQGLAAWLQTAIRSCWFWCVGIRREFCKCRWWSLPVACFGLSWHSLEHTHWVPHGWEWIRGCSWLCTVFNKCGSRIDEHLPRLWK